MRMSRDSIRYLTESSLAGLLLLSVVGCRENAPKTSSLKSSLPLEIRSIIGKQLHKEPDMLKPNNTFAAIGADDLDVVEITMAVEEKLGIQIDDRELSKAAGLTPDDSLCHRLTLEAFAAVASAAPKQPPQKQKKRFALNTNELNEAEVGSFGELSKKPNPKRYVLVFVPDLETVTKLSEQKWGRPISEEERDQIKTKAVVIALPRDAAEKFEQERAKRQPNLK